MHTVCELANFRRDAEDAGMTDDEIENLVSLLAENPLVGDELQGTGGCRKFRLGGRGKGKSGGYRTITFYSGDQVPVFLITVFGKGEKASLSKAECNALKRLTSVLVDEYSRKVERVGDAR